MAGSVVALLNQDRMRIANDPAHCGEGFGEGISIVRVKDAAGQMLDFVVESLKVFSITAAENLSDSSP